MNIEQKKIEIAKLEVEQLKLMQKAIKIAQEKPTKNVKLMARRTIRAFGYMVQAKALQVQKMIIASQPSDESITGLKEGGIKFKK